MCSFLCKYLFHISFCIKLQSFWFSSFRNCWMKIVSKDCCTFTGIFIVIYMGLVTGSTLYLSENLKQSKCWTSEVSHPGCPISNCPTFQKVNIFFSLPRELTCPPYWLNLFFDIFNFFLCLLWLNSGYWITCQLYWFSCKSATVYVLHNSSSILADWYLSWLYLNFHWLKFCGGFEKNCKKIFPQTQSKMSIHIIFQGKMQFLQHWLLLQKNWMIRINSCKILSKKTFGK